MNDPIQTEQVAEDQSRPSLRDNVLDALDGTREFGAVTPASDPFTFFTIIELVNRLRAVRPEDHIDPDPESVWDALTLADLLIEAMVPFKDPAQAYAVNPRSSLIGSGLFANEIPACGEEDIRGQLRTMQERIAVLISATDDHWLPKEEDEAPDALAFPT